MRIALITAEYMPPIIGGAGVYAKNITNELIKLGHQVTVFTPISNNTKIVKENVEIVGIKINSKLPFKALQFWFKLPKEVKNAEIGKRFDIVHVNSLSYISLKNKITNAPHVYAIHHITKDIPKTAESGLKTRFYNIGNENSFLMPMLEKKVINNADHIIVPSNFTKNQIVHHYNVNSSNIDIVYYGMNHKKKFPEKKFGCLNANNRDFSGKKIILFVGRVDDPRKGLDMLLKAFKIILDEFDSKLVVVGSGNPEKAINISKSLDIFDRVFFAGLVSEKSLQSYYNLCDVYVLPSRLEGFGFTILEAIDAGKPVVAFNVGSVPELIKNYYNGILVEKNNINRFASSVCYLLNNGKLEWNTEERIRAIKEKFNWRNSAKELENIFQSLVDDDK